MVGCERSKDTHASPTDCKPGCRCPSWEGVDSPACAPFLSITRRSIDRTDYFKRGTLSEIRNSKLDGRQNRPHKKEYADREGLTNRAPSGPQINPAKHRQNDEDLQPDRLTATSLFHEHLGPILFYLPHPRLEDHLPSRSSTPLDIKISLMGKDKEI